MLNIIKSIFTKNKEDQILSQMKENRLITHYEKEIERLSAERDYYRDQCGLIISHPENSNNTEKVENKNHKRRMKRSDLVKYLEEQLANPSKPTEEVV